MKIDAKQSKMKRFGPLVLSASLALIAVGAILLLVRDPSSDQASSQSGSEISVSPKLQAASSIQPAPSLSPEPTDSNPSDSVVAADFDGIAQRFDVNGVEVIVRTRDGVLPTTASWFRAATTVISERDSEAVACMGVGESSLPPQCGGLALEGVDRSQLRNESDGVRYGYVDVVANQTNGVWAVESLARAANAWAYEAAIPAACSDTVHTSVDSEIVGRYGASLGPDNATVLRTGRDTWVLEVTKLAADHAQTLEDLGVVDPCVVEVHHVLTELVNIQSKLLRTQPSLIVESSPGANGRLDVHVGIADKTTVERLAAISGDPAAIRVIGHAEIG